jgi:hypothetical protein
MTAIAFLALALAFAVQSIRLQQALAREQRLQAEAQYLRARNLVDQMLAEVAEQPSLPSAVAPEP